MDEVPFVAIGNDELQEVTAEPGQAIRCRHCGARHALQASITAEGRPGPLLFYACHGADYLAAVDGRLLEGIELAEDGNGDRP